MIAAASPIAGADSRGDGSTRMFSLGSRGSWRAIAAACAPPVTTKVSSGVASGASRASVAWISVRSSPVSACRNFG